VSEKQIHKHRQQSRSGPGVIFALVLAATLGASLANAESESSATTSPPSIAKVQPAQQTVGPVGVSDPQLDVQESRFQIDGALGGSVRLGRFTLTVPPGAYYGKATITIAVPNRSKVACSLSISPASANGFSLPIVLTMKTKGCNTTEPLAAGYFDPALGRWTRVAGAYQDADSKDVIAPLYHFSVYGALPGRAGW
jgi:hypothetical protein